MGLFIELLIDPARITFMAFLLATALELKSRIAVGLTITLGAIVFAVLMPLVFRPTEAPGIALGLIANLLLLAIFYRFHTLVLRRLTPGSNRLSTEVLMGLFDLFRSRKALSERALLAEARARDQKRAMLRSAISTIGGEQIAAGSDTQLAPRSASLLTRHVMTPGSADDDAERLLAGMFAQIAAIHFSLEIGTNFMSAVAQSVLEITGIADRHDLGNIIGICYEVCADNDELTTTVRQFLADWMADPTQENLVRLGSLRLLLVRLMTDDGLGDYQKTTGSPSSPPVQRRFLLVNWDNRPAVIGEAGALAMLKPNSPWVEVNFSDVLWTARTLREVAWRGQFRSFGELHPPTYLLDQISRSPRQREPIVRSAAAPAASAPALPAGTSAESGCAAQSPGTTLHERPILLVNWDNRPAIISGGGAFAMLEPSSPWVEVDFRDVLWTSDVLTEAAWRERFKSFGELNPPTHLLDQVSPSPRAQEPVASQAPPPAASAPPSPALPAGAADESENAAPPETEPYKRPTNLVNWDNRPAIIGDAGAFAMLKPNSPWVEVDFLDVWSTADILSEEAWRERFKRFGELNPPMIDRVSPAAARDIE
ncbi:hypothetical protein IG197_04735 [Aminobacter sp. SR38]|jgi:hypothetical protein|uniref:hypothetical protein n=1 Tax=Aminobacter TaxID=31988 RepID=UPI00177EE207|nr:hypothetical protein [Aminobacter sp. SR38]QOF72395.1 hypothetical protein IG197_04735 [Aminobacter sp. SR38]